MHGRHEQEGDSDDRFDTDVTDIIGEGVPNRSHSFGGIGGKKQETR